MSILSFNLIKNKNKIFGFSAFLILLSLIGILYSTFNTSFKKPINLGMDFIGGNELRVERICDEGCDKISPDLVIEKLKIYSNNKNILNKIIWKSFNDDESYFEKKELEIKKNGDLKDFSILLINNWNSQLALELYVIGKAKNPGIFALAHDYLVGDYLDNTNLKPNNINHPNSRIIFINSLK